VDVDAHFRLLQQHQGLAVSAGPLNPAGQGVLGVDAAAGLIQGLGSMDIRVGPPGFGTQLSGSAGRAAAAAAAAAMAEQQSNRQQQQQQQQEGLAPGRPYDPGVAGPWTAPGAPRGCSGGRQQH